MKTNVLTTIYNRRDTDSQRKGGREGGEGEGEGERGRERGSGGRELYLNILVWVVATYLRSTRGDGKLHTIVSNTKIINDCNVSCIFTMMRTQKIMHLDWEKSKSHLGLIHVIVGKEGEISSTSTNNLACTQLRRILNFATSSHHEIT